MSLLMRMVRVIMSSLEEPPPGAQPPPGLPPPGLKAAKLDGYVKYPGGVMGAPGITVTAKTGTTVSSTTTGIDGYFSMLLLPYETYDVQAARVLHTAVWPIYLPPEGVSTVLVLKL